MLRNDRRVRALVWLKNPAWLPLWSKSSPAWNSTLPQHWSPPGSNSSLNNYMLITSFRSLMWLCTCYLQSSTSSGSSEWHCTQHQNTDTHPRGSSPSQRLTDFPMPRLFPCPELMRTNFYNILIWPLPNRKNLINTWRLQLLPTVKYRVWIDQLLVVVPWWGTCLAPGRRIPG
jgi:hypothetical protein